MKLNFGSAHDKISGFQNVDALDWEGNTDVICNMNVFPYPFEDETAEEIRSVECLEHLSFKITGRILKEFYRILKPNGLLHIQVPDAGKAMNYYVYGQVCSCIPHKSVDGMFLADPLCPKCSGKAKINWQRWLFTFTGAGKHRFDFHLAIFTRAILKAELENAGFRDINFTDDIYKLKVNCKK